MKSHRCVGFVWQTPNAIKLQASMLTTGQDDTVSHQSGTFRRGNTCLPAAVDPTRTAQAPQHKAGANKMQGESFTFCRFEDALLTCEGAAGDFLIDCSGLPKKFPYRLSTASTARRMMGQRWELCFEKASSAKASCWVGSGCLLPSDCRAGSFAG